jgi:hypothetical protein
MSKFCYRINYPLIFFQIYGISNLTSLNSVIRKIVFDIEKIGIVLENSTSENLTTGLVLMSNHRSISINTEEVINNFANLP